MSTEQNKAILLQVYEAAFNQKNLDALDEVIASDSTDHNLTPEQPPGLEGAKQVFSSFHTAFPDLLVNVEDMIAADLAIKCATHSGSTVGRKIRGPAYPRLTPMGFHAFHKPDFPPSQIRLCVPGFMTRFDRRGR